MLFSRMGAGIAALLALLGLVACQDPDSTPVPSAPSEAEGPAKQRPGIRGVPEAPAAKAGAVQASSGDDVIIIPSTCNINFNDADGLAMMSDHAHRGWSSNPWYKHPCNNYRYLASVYPLYKDYRLIPEKSTWCTGLWPKIGTRSGDACINQTEGKYWARRAGNAGGGTGLEVLVPTSTGHLRFDLRSLYVYSGTVELEAYRPDVGIWVSPPLTAGTTWTWPEGFTVSYLKIFRHGRNGYFQIDNLEIAIRP